MAIIGSHKRDDKLPEEGIDWPPWDYHDEYEKFKEWAAWYSSDPVRLSNVFSDRVTPAGGLDVAKGEGRLWASDIREEVRTMLHVPTGSDIAAVSADLLFGEPPEFSIPATGPDGESRSEGDVEKTEDRLREIVKRGEVHSRLVKGAETASALGGTYLKADWDRGFKDFPIMTVAQADNALPEFYHGFLRRVLFHKTVAVKGVGQKSQDEEKSRRENSGTYFRHLEYREPGLIQHGLFRGTVYNLGQKIPLDSRLETQGLEEEIKNPAGIEDDPLVRYIPNMRPNRLWRNSSLGQSDYQGVEGMMDALDATYTSWVRDLKLAKARILAPRHMLEDENGELKFDLDKSVYEALESTPSPNSKQGQIIVSQFNIRSQQHYDLARELYTRIVDHAGYSPQTFGLNEGGQPSGEARKQRERKSVNTKNKKERYFKDSACDILKLMLRIDQNKFDSDIEPYRPDMSFADSYQPTIKDVANTMDILNRANSASIEVRVRRLHPDWSKEEVEEEVEKIKDEQGMNVQPPEMRA